MLARSLSSVRQQVIDHLAPGEQGRLDSLEHRGELLVWVVVVDAIGVVPLAREIDFLMMPAFTNSENRQPFPSALAESDPHPATLR